MEDETIILEAVIEVPKEQHWLSKPENKHILKRVEESLKQEANIKRSYIKHKYKHDN